jgi:hypothetical protein
MQTVSQKHQAKKKHNTKQTQSKEGVFAIVTPPQKEKWQA